MQRSCRKLGRHGPNTARKRDSAMEALRAMALKWISDAHFDSPIEPATKSLSGPCRCLATPSKPRANGLSEGRSGYLGGRRSAGRRRRRSAGRSAGRWRSPWRSVGRAAVSVSVGPSFTRRENARISRQFQFKAKGTLPNLTLPENKRGEAESYTKVHFSE